MRSDNFILITTILNGASIQRHREFSNCIEHNLSNPHIDKVIIFLEKKANEEFHEELNKWEHKEEVVIKIINSRPSYKDFFDYCNQFDQKWILCNSDIYFPTWNSSELSKLSKENYDENFFVLTRYNLFDNYSEKQKQRYTGHVIEREGKKLITMWGAGKYEGWSIDSWIFETPFNNLNANFEIPLGTYYCDSMMNHELSKIRKLKNPCLSIISIHEHQNWNESKYNENYIGSQKYDARSYVQEMESRGFRGVPIKFSKLEGCK